MLGGLGAGKLIGVLGLALLLLLVLGAASVYALSEQRLNASISVRPARISVPSDIAAVQHGQHIAGAIALCTTCHGASLGGAIVVDDASARVAAPNITRGGQLAAFSDADYVRAIRDGVGRDGRALWLMPTDQYSRLGDMDLGALIAYLKMLPPQSDSFPTEEIRPLGRVLVVTGRSPLLPPRPVGPAPAAPPPDVSPAYGEYLSAIAGCARCHGPGLSGGSVPNAPRGAPAATNLTPSGLGGWSEADFLRAMRSGRRPDGTAMDTAMPWPYYAQMSELELRAIWQFLGVVPPRPTGTR
jgi:cytochrome c553